MLPKARSESLIIEELPDETLVYDRNTDKAHCLNTTAAFVWKHCDGRTSVAELAELLESNLNIPADEQVVWLALDRLVKSKLLERPVSRPASLGMISRRDLAKRIALAGGVAVALPIITSIIAPHAADAASPIIVPVGGVCGPDSSGKTPCVLSPNTFCTPGHTCAHGNNGTPPTPCNCV